MSRLVSLSLAGIGTCCSATRRGSSGGGRDCVPVFDDEFVGGIGFANVGSADGGS